MQEKLITLTFVSSGIIFFASRTDWNIRNFRLLSIPCLADGFNPVDLTRSGNVIPGVLHLLLLPPAT
jgi:hypothetical protein